MILAKPKHGPQLTHTRTHTHAHTHTYRTHTQPHTHTPLLQGPAAPQVFALTLFTTAAALTYRYTDVRPDPGVRPENRRYSDVVLI